MTERILVLRAGAIGDVVVSFPALAALRAWQPAAHLCLAGRTEARHLARAAGLADEVRDIGDLFFAPLFASEMRAEGGPLATFLASFDRVVSLLGDPEGSIARALRALGARDILSFTGMRSGVHAARQLFDVLAPWNVGTFPEGEPRAVPVPVCMPGLPKDFAVVHPGSGSKAKNWPGASFRAVIERAADAGHAVLVPCGEADADTVSAAIDGTAARIVRLELVELAGVLRRARFFVGNDSGIAHVAGAMGVRTLAIFGPTDPAVWRPLGPGVHVVGGAGGAFPTLGEVLAVIGPWL